MGTMAVRVTNVRKGAGYAEAFFTTLVGIEENGQFEAAVSIRDCELRESKELEKYTRFPQKKREKNGQPVLENGKAIYDSVVDAAMTKKPVGDGYQATKLGRFVKEEATRLVVAQLPTLGAGDAPRALPASSRAATPRSAAPSRAGTQATTGDAAPTSDDLPF